jgi:hypothetical protein
MSKGLVLAGVGLALVTVAPLVAAHQEVQSYNLALNYLQWSPLGLNFGGVRFDPNGEVPVRVEVEDVLSPNVDFFVCQDLNDDLTCGDDGTLGPREPAVSGCGGSVDLSSSGVPFRTDEQTLVFVYAVGITGCLGPGTTGVVKLDFSP